MVYYQGKPVFCIGVSPIFNDYRLDMRFDHNYSDDSVKRARITVETLDN
jgi:hypothetical protein